MSITLAQPVLNPTHAHCNAELTKLAVFSNVKPSNAPALDNGTIGKPQAILARPVPLLKVNRCLVHPTSLAHGRKVAPSNAPVPALGETGLT